MEDSGEGPSGLRVLLTVAAAPVGAGVRALQGAPGLDVALWAVLAPILVATALMLVPQTRQQAPSVRGRRAQVVVPESIRRDLP